MKRFKNAIIMLILASFLLISLSGCYGTFTLTKKLYKFNGTLGDKYIKSLAMWGLILIPVYPACGAIDFWFLNTIEFWTGSNPLAMKKDEQNIKYYTENGANYKVVTSQNRYDIYDLDHNNDQVSFVFDAEKKDWLMEKDGKQVTIIDENNNMVKFFDTRGKLVKVQAKL